MNAWLDRLTDLNRAADVACWATVSLTPDVCDNSGRTMLSYDAGDGSYYEYGDGCGCGVGCGDVYGLRGGGGYGEGELVLAGCGFPYGDARGGGRPNYLQ